jgi:hypothetical protein
MFDGQSREAAGEVDAIVPFVPSLAISVRSGWFVDIPGSLGRRGMITAKELSSHETFLADTANAVDIEWMGIYPLGWCGIKRRKRGLVGVTRLSASWTRVEIVVVSILLPISEMVFRRRRRFSAGG